MSEICKKELLEAGTKNPGEITHNGKNEETIARTETAASASASASASISTNKDVICTEGPTKKTNNNNMFNSNSNENVKKSFKIMLLE